MKTSGSSQKILIIIIALIIVSFLVWFGAVLWFGLVMRNFGISTDFWAMLEALSTAVAATAVFAAGFIAYRELSEISNSRYLEVADRLFEELNSPENIEARRWIFQNLPDQPEEGLLTLTQEGRAALKRALNSLDRVAFLTQSGWIEEDMVMPWMNPMIVKVWAKVGSYVEYESRRRNEPDYYKSARLLAERCQTWRAKNLPDAKITWVENAL